MESVAIAPIVTEDPKLVPNEKELRALRLHVSADETRPHMATIWRYSSDGGSTHVATDGHTIAVRRAGTHRTMTLHDIAKLSPRALSGYTEAPPRWESILKAGTAGKLAPAYGINPNYVARVGDVERAVWQRNADDFVPKPGMSMKEQKQRRSDLKNGAGACAVWTIPSDPLDGWFWRLDTTSALWEGVVMPRRV